MGFKVFLRNSWNCTENAMQFIQAIAFGGKLKFNVEFTSTKHCGAELVTCILDCHDFTLFWETALNVKKEPIFPNSSHFRIKGDIVNIINRKKTQSAACISVHSEASYQQKGIAKSRNIFFKLFFRQFKRKISRGENGSKLMGNNGVVVRAFGL